MKKFESIQKLAAGLIGAAAIGLLVAGAFPMQANAEELTGKTAMEITQMMGKGWNLGNTFDATGGNRSNVYSQETSWGNPQVTKELIDGVKAAGFDTIRIPVTWYRHITTGDNYKIDDEFMARIKEVVDYAYDNDMYIILNVHHEAWVNDKNLDQNYEKIGEELVAVWKQIANTFADYDQHLIFEGMNEPRAEGTSYEWTGTSACYDAVNYLTQCFVTTIRENGKGHNSERALMIPGYAASSSATVLKSIVIPQVNGQQAENVIISVHCYSPYNFCLSDAQETFNPNSIQDTGDITSLMSTLNQVFLSKGVPVVIGECGATNSHDNDDARKAWFTYIGDITASYGIPAVVWDNGAKGKSGGECHNYFNRKTGEQAYPELITAFIYGDVEAKKPKDMAIDFEPYKDGETTVIASPEQYGFTPKNLGKMAKVNHSEGAAVGFSAAITSGEDFYATMDLSKFGGQTINVGFYLQSKSSDSVTIGMVDGSVATDIVTANIDGDWTYVTFSYKFSEGEAERAMTFKGAGADDFYLDDITITMVSDGEAVATYVGKEAGESAVTETPAESSETADSTGTEESKESTSEGEPVVTEPKSKTSVLPGVIVGVVLVMGVAVFAALKKKKK